jgi:hypothetical protein
VAFDLSKLPAHVLAARQRIKLAPVAAPVLQDSWFDTLSPESKSRFRVAITVLCIRTALMSERSRAFCIPRWYHDSRGKLPAHLKASEAVDPAMDAKLREFIFTHYRGSLQDFVGFDWYCFLRDLPTNAERSAMLADLVFYSRLALSLDSKEQKLQLVNGIKMKTSDAIPADVMANLQTELTSLETALKAKDPMMPHHLQRSHAMLKDYPELVNLLDREEVALIIDALEIHTKTEIVKASTKTKAGNARAAKLTASDL